MSQEQNNIGGNTEQGEVRPKVVEVRPQVLECDVVRFQNNKDKWVAFVGLLDGRPYEIFTGLQDDEEGIVLPKTVVPGQQNPDMKPCKFKATINYVDETGAAKTFNCNNTQFQTNPEKVDTVVLAEAFHFPTCNYDQSSIKVSVKIQCSILARETSKFAREMYLDCIYLRPRTSKSE